MFIMSGIFLLTGLLLGLIGFVLVRVWGDPYPNICNKADYIGGGCILTGGGCVLASIVCGIIGLALLL